MANSTQRNFGNTRVHDLVFAILIVVTIAATAWFGWAGYKDTAEVVSRIYDEPGLNTTALVQKQLGSAALSALTVYAALEGDTIVARNNRAASFLATRTWLRFLITMFGAILIIFGATFVLGRVSIDAANLQASSGLTSASLATTSPGIILAVLGVGLMAWPLASPGEITTNDGASFGTFLISEGTGEGPNVMVQARAGRASSMAPKLQSDAEIDIALSAAGIAP